MRYFSLLLYLTASALAQIVGAETGLAQDPARACTVSDPRLEESEAGVEPGIPIFHYNNDNYETKIYGLAVADPQITEPPFRICRRYEFENTSGHDIQELRWPDIPIGNIANTPPGKTYRFPKPVLNNTREVGPGPTDLYAWEDIKAPSVTVFPKIVGLKKAQLDLERNWVYALSPKAFPGALDGISVAGLSLDTTQSFYAPVEQFTYPELQSGIVSDDLSFLIFSRATVYPEKRYVESTFEIKASWQREGTPALHAPGVITLSKADFQEDQNIQARIQHFAATLGEHREDSGMSLLSQGLQLDYPLAKDEGQPVLFVVNQPIKFALGDWSACLMAPVYTAVPILLSSDEYCQ
jgi:hypothetical protein